MKQDLFWVYHLTYADMGGKGFSIFSLPHLLWLLLAAAGCVIYTVLYRRGGEQRRDNMRKGMALFLILFEIT